MAQLPARTVIDAVCQRYLTFGFAGKPNTLWFGPPPIHETDGRLTKLPVCELFDEGGENRTTFGHACLEHRKLRIEVYADSMKVLEDIVLGLKYNGGRPDGGLGFHHAAGLGFDSTRTFMAMYLTAEPTYEFVQDRSTDALRVYRAVSRYTVESLYTG